MRFLDDACQRNVLRTVGPVYQFRHTRLQDRLAEPDLEFWAFCTSWRDDRIAARRSLPASSAKQLERAWDDWQAERYQRGEISQRPGITDNPFRPCSELLQLQLRRAAK